MCLLHLDPHFGFKSQINKTFDCERLRCFEHACELCILPVCVLPSLRCGTKFSKACEEKKQQKKCVRKKKSVSVIVLLPGVP